MEGKIATIKDAIENVENTYKKMLDAYSQTSKGETKDIYSDIISGAKANCEKDVEKSRSEIARLNSDIEAIKNNIQEFERIIDSLNKTLENSRVELSKYNKALVIMEKNDEKLNVDLDDVENNPDKPKASAKKKDVIKEEPKKEVKPVEKKVEKVPEIKDEVVETPIEEVKEEPKVEVETQNIYDSQDSLQRIYDLTGYKPEEKKEEVVEDNHTTYNDNLENLFLNSNEEIKPEKPSSFEEGSMSEWEKILNSGVGPLDYLDDLKQEQVVEPSVKTTIQENVNDNVDQLLNPYGTTFNRLKSIVGDKIEYMDGSSKSFELSTDDIIKAVNSIDGNDLKKMKIVGPEVTLLRKVKAMKEGK